MSQKGRSWDKSFLYSPVPTFQSTLGPVSK